MSQEYEPHHHHDHPGDDVQEHREHGAPLTEVELRVRALESLLVDKGLVDPAALDAIIDTYETKVGPRNGAKVVAHAWVDPDYRRRLLEDGTAAVAEFGFVGRQSEKIVVVENTPKVHNMVVCTLCSCYPWAVLGLPPVWYKSAPYRSRAVIDPRGESYTAESIGERLSVRNFMDGLRGAGVETGGHAAYGPREKQAFANALDRALTRALRAR